MSIKISRLDNESNEEFDFNLIEAALHEDEISEMTKAEVEELNYKNSGEIPKKIALANVSKFGMRRAYFDIFKHENDSKPGVWKLEKDADGNEWIVKAEQA